MKKENCKRKLDNRKRIGISIRTTKGISQWMKAEGLSPTAIFHEAIKELGYKETK